MDGHLQQIKIMALFSPVDASTLSEKISSEPFNKIIKHTVSCGQNQTNNGYHKIISVKDYTPSLNLIKSCSGRTHLTTYEKPLPMSMVRFARGPPGALPRSKYNINK